MGVAERSRRVPLLVLCLAFVHKNAGILRISQHVIHILRHRLLYFRPLTGKKI